MVNSLQLGHISEKHNLQSFDCGHIPEMNDWLKNSALNSHNNRMSRVFVLSDGGADPLGFFTLSGFCLEVNHLSRNDGKRYTSVTVPAHYLGRIAVDKSLRGKAYGKFLMAAAFKKYAQILELTTSNFLFLHANDEFLVQYYAQYGFKRSPIMVEEGAPIPMYIKSAAILKFIANSTGSVVTNASDPQAISA